MKIREALLQSAEIISKRWPQTPFLDAQVLLQNAYGISKETLLTLYNEEMPEKISAVLSPMVEKRISGYPVAYITGKKEFYSRLFHVDENVLIPRPDTEILVEKTIDEAMKMSKQTGRQIRILDLCTGSGCIAITLKAELGERADIYASDISTGAEKTFAENCDKILGHRLPFIRGNLFEPFKGKKVKFNIIASNPPYLTNSHVNTMVLNGWPEPEEALRGGDGGLDLIERIVCESVTFIEEKGMLCMEAEASLMSEISKMLCKQGFTDISIIKDLAGRERVIVGWLK